MKNLSKIIELLKELLKELSNKGELFYEYYGKIEEYLDILEELYDKIK